MTDLKIINNPYNRTITFQSRNGEDTEWEDISVHTDDSCLLDDKYSRKSFFPFVVSDITDIIFREYSNGDPVNIIYEGPEEQFKDLQAACREASYHDLLIPAKSERYLENARDVLPQIEEIYKNVYPVIDQTIRAAVYENDSLEDLTKYSDAVKPIVPICLIGNYSSGKSTLINALIGNEILPNGEKPVTSKIYKIFNDKSEDRAVIDFSVGEKNFEIRFEPDRYVWEIKAENNDLTRKIDEALQEKNDSSIALRVSMAIRILNDFNDDSEVINDLIEIHICFNGEFWNKSKYKFVIFDTPGDNSASNENHLKVLKNAMENLTNGMPIYVCNKDSLNTTDNDDFSNQILAMDELDSRFILIAINKADQGDATNEGVMDEVIPKKLYSGGIFYVSSILGLGAKTKGTLRDRNAKMIYSSFRNHFDNPDDEFYMQLYKLDILPKQLSEVYQNYASEYGSNSNDLIYANSGLLSIEQGIQAFADLYSPYNKCQQSKLYLSKVIASTSKDISKQTKNAEDMLTEIKNAMDEHKRLVLDELLTKIHSLSDQDNSTYIEVMNEKVKEVKNNLMKTSFRDIQQSYLNQERKEHKLDDTRVELQQETLGLFKDTFDNLITVIRKLDADPLLDDLSKKAKKIHELSLKLSKDHSESVEDASQLLLDTVNESFKSDYTDAQKILNEFSGDYWMQRTGELKTELEKIVTESSNLSEEERTALDSLIDNYSEIQLGDIKDDIFPKIEYEYLIRLGQLKLFRKPDLFISRLRNQYNEKIYTAVMNIVRSIEKSHQASFLQYTEDLYNRIQGRLIDENPTLKDKNEKMKQVEANIADLNKRSASLENAMNEIMERIDWKTV